MERSWSIDTKREPKVVPDISLVAGECPHNSLAAAMDHWEPQVPGVGAITVIVTTETPMTGMIRWWYENGIFVEVIGRFQI